MILLRRKDAKSDCRTETRWNVDPLKSIIVTNTGRWLTPPAVDNVRRYAVEAQRENPVICRDRF
ncbi:hypothetical protein N7453_007850 [Penicillium expansum]|nr:hypothetical protein N7453_007850 [Penicillium expansum]